jgi:microcin C transport system ATP-binding protein
MNMLLEAKDLRVSFGGKEVVHGVDLAIAPGEKLALVGESGSGKTVTALSLVRLVQGARVTGSARLAPAHAGGAPIELLQASERELLAIRGRDIAMIFQEPMTALNPLYTVGDQIAEVLQIKQALTQRQAWQGAIDALAATGIPEPARRANAFPHQLSGGQRQRAMIAMALACRPRLLLADEPTTALDVTLRQQILDLLADLQRDTGMAVLLITHDLNLVRRFADRVAVMESGYLVEQGKVEDVFRNPQHAYTRKLIESRPPRDVPEPRAGEPPVMRADNLRVSYPVPIPGFQGWFRKGEFVAVQGAKFELPPGGTVGIVGESGSGKSTLALAALGLIPHRGELEVVGKRWGPDAAGNRAIRRLVQVVFQDPFSSLNPRMKVRDILAEPLINFGIVRGGRELTERVEQLMDKVQLPRDAIGRYPHEFSGGQRQRIGIARALAPGADLIICDEAVSALDVSVKAQIINLLVDLQDELGLALLFISHDLAIVEHLTHRVAVMYLGRIVELADRRTLFAQSHHPYTRALLSAVPVPDPTAKRQRIILTGDVPSPINPPSGCRFHTRCPFAFDRCRVEEPILRPVGEGHVSACHLDHVPGGQVLPIAA